MSIHQSISAGSVDSSKSSSSSAYGSTITICSMSFALWDQASENLSLSSYQANPYMDIQGREGSEIAASYADDSSLNHYRPGTNRFSSIASFLWFNMVS